MSKPLIEKAQKILLNNHQKGGFTIPTENLYPFQWMWDSGFIALGFAHFDIEKAKSEINNILNAQWDNGFIPHIVFILKKTHIFQALISFNPSLVNFHQKNLKLLELLNHPCLDLF